MLDRILQQPEPYRRKIAYLLTFVIGIAIFSVWLVIAGFDVNKSSRGPTDQDNEVQTAKQFQNNLPTLSQEQQVTTELSKQNAAKANDSITQEEKQSVTDKLFGGDDK